MTVQQITEKLQKNKATAEGERLQFATIVRASVTEMNLDGPLKDVISIKWYFIFILTLYYYLYKLKN